MAGIGSSSGQSEDLEEFISGFMKPQNRDYEILIQRTEYIDYNTVAVLRRL